MSNETYQQIYNEYFHNEEQEAVNESVIQKLKTKQVVRDQTNICAICLKNYRKGEKVFALNCSHHFHISCIEPWLKKIP